MKEDFIPSTKAELDAWEVNFKQKVTAISEKLKLPDDDTNDTITLLDAHRSAYAAMVQNHSEAKAATSMNNAARKKAEKAIRDLVRRIKGAKGYNEAMGKELGIIGSDTTFDKAIAKPVITLSLSGGAVTIKFNRGQTDGVHIYSRRAGEKEFSLLAVDTASPYNDNRSNKIQGQPETREYKAWYFIDDTIIGLESDVASISV